MRGCDKTASSGPTESSTLSTGSQAILQVFDAGPGSEWTNMACHDATPHGLLAELGFLIRTGLGYGPPPAQPLSPYQPLARNQPQLFSVLTDDGTGAGDH